MTLWNWRTTISVHNDYSVFRFVHSDGLFERCMLLHLYFVGVDVVAGQAFDHKIRRSAVRDGLNLISISPSMVMAGTGEISCLRRLRFAYGMYHQMMYHPDFKYGIHVAAHMSLGLRFLGGGWFTPPLPVRSRPSSPAPITCLPIIKFPSSATPSAGPRHQATVFARDMETTEVVYDGKEVGTTQLISPFLIWISLLLYALIHRVISLSIPTRPISRDTRTLRCSGTV
jgi:hypothetical protein